MANKVREREKKWKKREVRGKGLRKKGREGRELSPSLAV